MSVYEWVKCLIMMALGALCMEISYDSYRDYQMRNEAIKSGQQVWMKIKSRRASRAKSPAYIVVEHAGQNYNLESSPSYYRDTQSADSVLVFYDPEKDVASLPGWKVQKLVWLSVMIAILGLACFFEAGRTLLHFRK